MKSQRFARSKMAWACFLGALLLAVACARGEPTATPAPAPRSAPAPTPAVAPAPTPTRAPVAAQPTPTPIRAAAQTPAPAAAPAVQPKYGGIFYLATSANPITFDIHQERNIISLVAARPAYDNLVTYELGPSGKVVPDLAQSWEVSPDGKVYTFKLHQGVRWQDGKPLTAEDVVFSINRWKSPPKGTISPREQFFTGVTRVEAPDPSTVKLTLSEPEVAILSKLAGGYMAIMPKHVIEERGHMKEVVMGSGPFRFKSYIPGSRFEFVKNQDYWVKGKPYLDGFATFMVPDATASLAAFRTGRIHARGATPSELEILKKSQPDLVALREIRDAEHLFFNSGKKPFDDVRVRRALFLMYDRQRAVEILAEKNGIPGGEGPSESPWGLTLEERLKLPGWRQPKDQDIAEAKRLLAEAGYSKGFSFVMTVRRTSDPWIRHATYIIDEFKPYNITATMDLVDTPTHLQRRREGTLDAHPTSATWNVPDPDSYLARYYACDDEANLAINFCDQELDRLFAQIRITADFTKRNELYRKAELRIYELAPAIPGVFRLTYQVTQSYLRNYPPGPTSQEFHQHRDVWLDR